MCSCPMARTSITMLVKDGWCWWYRKYAPGDTVLEGLEKEAREAKKGLWADPQPVPPWEWRIEPDEQPVEWSGAEGGESSLMIKVLLRLGILLRVEIRGVTGGGGGGIQTLAGTDLGTAF